MKANWQSGDCHQKQYPDSPHPFSAPWSKATPRPAHDRFPDTHLDSSVAYGQKLGWNMAFPECSWAFLLQNLFGRLEDSMVFGIGVSWTEAFNLELGIKV